MVDFVPRDEQPEIIAHIQELKRCGVWAVMGGGKTGSTIKALDDLSLVEDVFPALVLAPLRVANSTWVNEVDKFDNFKHLRVSPIAKRRNPTVSATAAERRAMLRLPAELYTLPYGSIQWLVEELDGKWPFRTIVSDEWTRLKSFRTRQGGANAGALGKVAHGEGTRFIGLTGTPSPKGLEDLWGQMHFVDKGDRLGKTFSAFDARWFRKGFDGFSREPFPHSQKEIQDLLRDVCITIEGPPVDKPIVSEIHVELPPKVRELYREMERNFFIELEEIGVEAVNAAVKTNKLLQIASGAVFDDERQWHEVHGLKLEALESVVEEANGMPVLVQYNFVPDRERILKHFKQAKFLSADPKIEASWNRGEIPILVASAASAGHGLNLQDGGNILCRYSYDWNHEYFAQIAERIGPLRQKQSGHDRRVYHYPIVATGTMDEVVLERHESKKSVQDILLAALKRHKEQTQ